MIKSMTAFASGEKTEGNITAGVEIRSYNSRYLDIVLRIPQNYLGFEDKIKKLISEKIARGRIELRLNMETQDEESLAFEVDKAKAKAFYKALCDLKGILGMDSEVTLKMLTGVQGIIKPAEIEIDPESIWPVIEECVKNALFDLDKMRQKEGGFLARDFDLRLEAIEEAIVKIESLSANLIEHYKERLVERIGELTKGTIEIDEARIVQEAAFLADRSDISEEIIRAKSHVSQFKSIMAKDGPSGRKLNFLLQEFNREFNTMGAKSGNADLSHIIVNLKSELEKIREQVQNVE